jgi:peptidoglycan/xylan/chitin deacetylase (PgdA/CDA1 family)
MGWLWQVVGVLAGVSLLAGLAEPSLPASEPPAVTRTQAAPPPALPADPPTATPPAPPPPPDAGTPAPVDCTKLKCVALTMDDGPVAKTGTLLALLRRKHVHATFFLLGRQAKAHPAIVRRMLADGNAIGNHSWSHPEFWGLPAKKVRAQLARTDAVLEKITGRRPTLVRPPFGEFNHTVKKVAKARGQALVLWDVDPQDWKKHKASVVAKRVIAHARRGSIILTHDVWPSTRHAYARIIDGLRAKGFTLVTVPELFGGRLKPGKVYFKR